MEIRQLEYFVAVAEEQSFTRAAARVHVAQPGISAQIRRLERELGEELFDRSGRTVRLTAVGAALLPHARAALAAFAGVRATVDDLAGLVRGRVAVGMVTACAITDLFDLLEAFHRAHPAVAISLSEGNSDRLVADLRGGQLDMALVATSAAPTPADLATLVIADEVLVAVVHPDDPLAAAETVTVAELAERPLICLPRGTGIRTAVEDGWAASGRTPRIGLEASSPAVLAELASRGLGVAIVPMSTADAQGAGLQVLRIAEPRLRGRIELAWRRDGPLSPATRALIALAQIRLAPVTDDASQMGSDVVEMPDPMW